MSKKQLSKTEYLQQLEKYLKKLPKEDFEDAMEYFTEYFEDADDEGAQALMEELGTPKEAARDLMMNLLDRKLTDISPDTRTFAASGNTFADSATPSGTESTTGRKIWKSILWISLLVLFAIPIGAPLLISVVVVLLCAILCAIILDLCVFIAAFSGFLIGCKLVLRGLLALPVLGVILVNVIPIIFMICVAFTNYDMDHQPPTYLFTWVGLKNFRQLFTSSATVTFGYAFIRILFWTLLWALLATFSTYFGGIMLAKLINDRQVRWKKMWRTLFVITIAIPQFVTLLLVGKMFGDYGIVNSICSKTGLTDLLRQIGLVGKGLSYIPFLTKPGWAHVMIVLINIWVGVPFQMLSATGILMNIPHEQMESAKIDGANERQIFWKITMPYMLFVTGPSLLTALIANINNFNVIYLLTTDYVTSNMNYANSNAKEVDLLVTWLFRLTNDYSNYKMASVIGICVFCICAVLTLIGFTRMIAGNKEEEFQ